MKAKFMNEDLGDVLKPKTPEDIQARLKNDPLLTLKREINNACKNFWMNGGLKFNEVTTPEQYDIVCKNLNIQSYKMNNKIREEKFSFIPILSTLKNDYYGLKVILYGYMELKNKKFSDKLTKIEDTVFTIDLNDKQAMKNINF